MMIKSSKLSPVERLSLAENLLPFCELLTDESSPSTWNRDAEEIPEQYVLYTGYWGCTSAEWSEDEWIVRTHEEAFPEEYKDKK